MPRRIAALMLVLCAGAIASAFTTAGRADLTGEWVLRLSGSTGTVASTLTLEQRGTALRGTNLSSIGTVRTVEGRVAGDTVTFTVPVTPGDDREVRYTGLLVGADSVAGRVDLAGTGTGTFSASRKR